MKLEIKFKHIFYAAVAIVLCIWIASSEIRCNKLQNELINQKMYYTEKIDSLIYSNNEHIKNIISYQDSIILLDKAIDSLNAIKNEVIVQKDGVVVSKTVSDGVELLKQNLDKWEE